ncbi:DUF3703 domain-containing protein [Leucothrix pacifica]|uniref:DUF3703 domain-containing protein n=1 Tax=Leucothrix pacifica TaxID=1247513 RepID=A0A317C6Z2_9GAMM|nr:DUF3703 domain-containing protein [Leucothrix pacifica]PWQ94415.1 hypothetical protein DKW60_16735 [Leucothrix pacifica]
MMTRFSKTIGAYVEKEFEESLHYREKGDVYKEFEYLENAHVIGQESTFYHVYVHWKMLLWGIRQRSIKEVIGQLFRILGAATKTAIGLVPQGNTGGSNVSPFQRMPIQPRLAKIIDHAKSQSGNSSL